MKITFLGTNGWYASSTGNTMCTLIEAPTRYIVLDAGDGIHRLDKFVKDENKPVDIFLSHFHLDHIIGLHIQPKFLFKNKIRIFGQKGVDAQLDKLINKPFTAPFSLLREKLNLDISVHEYLEGENKIDEYKVTTAPLIHADPCFGFRFELRDSDNSKKIISYCTDTGPCDNLIKLSKMADVLITECSLLPTDTLTPSWPHMTPQAGAQAAKNAQCKKLVLSHFVANKYDSFEKRDLAVLAAKKIFENTVGAKDELELEI